MRSTGYADYVGRVGALAVALGIGAALVHNASPVWADEVGSVTAGTGGGTGAQSGTARNTPPDVVKRSEQAEVADASAPGGTSTNVDDVDDRDDADSHYLDPLPAADDSAASPTEDQDEPAVDSDSSTNESSVSVDESEETPTDEVIIPAPEPDPAADPPASAPPTGGHEQTSAPRSELNGHQQLTRSVTHVGTSDADDSSASVKETEPESGDLSATLPESGTAPLVDAPSTTTAQSTSNAVEVPSAVSAAPDAPPRLVVSKGSAIMLNLLGLNDFDSGGAPVDSPLGLALLAIGTRSRASEQTGLLGGQQLSEALLSSATPDPYTVGTGSKPAGVVVSSDGIRVYVANTGSNTVSVINNDSTSSDYKKVIKTVSVGSSPSALVLSADGSRLYVANSGTNTVSVVAINVATDTYKRIDANPSVFSQDISVGYAPSALALNSDGTRLYVANRSSNTVSVIGINAATNTYKRIDANPSVFSQDISVGSAPSALALSPGGTRLYVANTNSNTVSVIDINSSTNTFSVVDVDSDVAGTQSVFVGSAPTSIAVSADGSRVYVALSSDMVAVIDSASNVVSLAAIDAAPETGAHSLSLGPDGAVYLSDAADGVLRSLSQVEGTVTIGRSKLELGTGNGYSVDATWYFPNNGTPPAGLIYLQHGGNRTDLNVAALAQQLAERTNSIVVTPTLSSNGSDRYYMSNAVTEQAVAALFKGNRNALTASATAAAGYQVTLPLQYVLAGHSLGGSVVTAAAGQIASSGDTSNLKALILFDRNGDDLDAVANLAKLTGTKTVPVRSISAPPCPCNGFGFGTTFTVNGQQADYVGVLLDGGTHLDSEGASTDPLGLVGCWQGQPRPSNAAAVQTLASEWINDVFTDSRTGIYDPAGTPISVAGATGRVLDARGVSLTPTVV